MIDLVHDLVFDYTLRTVALGSGILGVMSGTLGAYAVLRRQSLLGDAMSHAALPGIALAFLLTGVKEPSVLLLGAAVAGWIGTLAIVAIVRTTRIKYDSALGLVLSVFFGLGLVLLTFIQRRPDAAHAGLEKFLFGQAAALMMRDVVLMAVVSGIALSGIMLLWKELKLLSFDREFGASLGFPMGVLDVALSMLLVTAIALGLQAVGVVLMSAMIVAPAAAARQWTDRLGVMVVLSASFGALAGISGAVVSSSTARLPAGPTIVLCVSAVVGFSLVCAPKRGLLWNWLMRQRNRRRLQVEAVLERMYALARQHADSRHAHPIRVLRVMELEDAGLTRTLRELEQRGWVYRSETDRWGLTPYGLAEAEQRIAAEETTRG